MIREAYKLAKRIAWSSLDRVRGVDAMMWTWEMSVPFDDDPLPGNVWNVFSRDFPETSKKGEILFWKMVAFNGGEGRKIRYLVVKPCCDVVLFRRKYDRVLPRAAALYGVADDIIRNCADVDGVLQKSSGNVVFYFVLNGKLYVLVFCEGRLCHWSEEIGYEGSFDDDVFADRRDRFRRYLTLDDYFAGKENFVEICRNVDAATLDERLVSVARDPFWKKIDLDKTRRIKPAKKRLFAGALGLVCCIVFCLVNFPGCEENVVAERLDVELEAPPRFLSGEPRREGRPLAKKTGRHRLASRNYANDLKSGFCALPPLRLQGVVEGVLFQGTLDGESRWFHVGDSLGRFVVSSVAKDRVYLVCRKRVVEVKYGG